MKYAEADSKSMLEKIVFYSKEAAHNVQHRTADVSGILYILAPTCFPKILAPRCFPQMPERVLQMKAAKTNQ